MTAADWQIRILALITEAQDAGYSISLIGHCCPETTVEISNEDSTDMVEFSF